MVVPANGSITTDCVQFQPQLINAMNATLLIKNNLTLLHPVKLLGAAGKGKLSIVEVRRSVRDEKTGDLRWRRDTTQVGAHTAIRFSFLQRSDVMRVDLSQAETKCTGKCSEERRSDGFTNAFDLLCSWMNTATGGIFGYMAVRPRYGLDTLEHPHKGVRGAKLRLERVHRRVVVLQNTGNLAMAITAVMLDG